MHLDVTVPEGEGKRVEQLQGIIFVAHALCASTRVFRNVVNVDIFRWERTIVEELEQWIDHGKKT
jgi:hypothetical protein